MTSEVVVKYSWQFGPFEKDPKVCNHEQDTRPYNDTFSVFKCDGEQDSCICIDCGTIKTFHCNFDEEYK